LDALALAARSLPDAASRKQLRRVPAVPKSFHRLRLEDKYKAKSFIDTFVYRAGDQIGAWSCPLLTWLSLGLTGISFVAVPLAALWCGLSLWLSRKQGALTREREGQVV
jgi:AAA family ATP:ADP antiporter